MNEGGRKHYTCIVGFHGWRRRLAGLLFVFAFFGLDSVRASADVQSIASSGSPVIFGQLQYGSIVVRTWDRSDVQIDADPTVNVRHIERVPPVLPFQLFFSAQTVQTPDGPLELPPEPFQMTPLDSAPHDAVGFNGTGNITITIPSGTPLLITRMGEGEISIDGYHGGTFFAHVRAGALRLTNVSGTGGFQINNGPAIVRNCTFDRVRARSGRGSMFFANTSSRQIDATSLLGSITYDNGSFEPGLARFETQRGNIALGVRGEAQIDAHSGSGHVVSDGTFRSGPVVTATSATGSVYTYSGSIREHPNLMHEMQPRAGAGAGQPRLPQNQNRPRPTAPANAPRMKRPKLRCCAV